MIAGSSVVPLGPPSEVMSFQRQRGSVLRFSFAKYGAVAAEIATFQAAKRDALCVWLDLGLLVCLKPSAGFAPPICRISASRCSNRRRFRGRQLECTHLPKKRQS